MDILSASSTMPATCPSPYLGPDPDSPIISSCTPHDSNQYVLTPGRTGGRKRVSVIGGYKLGRTLGKGSCGVVKLGTHLETGKRVAIKVLRPKNDRERSEIQREIAALRELNHPYIINLLEVVNGCDLKPCQTSLDGIENEGKSRGLDKYIFMVLELASGGELFEKVLNGGALSQNEARRCFRQILSALIYTHAHLICHRDLKPENILFDADGNVKISDFGLSNTAQPGKLFGTWCGSPMYAPPEVVMEQKYKGWAVDVWSLGIILYVMVTGGMPWRLERGQVRDMELFLSATYRVPDDMGIERECKDLLNRMIQSNPNNRACLRELSTHPWVTANGTLPPVNSMVQLPDNITKCLRPLPPDGAGPQQYTVDEELLFQVQEVIGLDICGIDEARADIRDMRASPALTAYSRISQMRRPPSMSVGADQLPGYMTRHRRNRSECPRPSSILLGPSTSLINSPPVARAAAAPVAVVPVEAVEACAPAAAAPELCVEALPFSPRPAQRPRATSSPAAYRKIAAHQTPAPATTVCVSISEADETPDACRMSPKLGAREAPCDVDRLSERSRREEKHSATRHVLRTLVLKLKWGKK